jgi:hypothetical protein
MSGVTRRAQAQALPFTNPSLLPPNIPAGGVI